MKILYVFLLISSLIGCEKKPNVNGSYSFSTKVLRSDIVILPDNTFAQTVTDSKGSLSLRGQWDLRNNVIEFSKLYYITDTSNPGHESDLQYPKLMHLASFQFRGDMFYVEDQRQIYRKASPPP